jgi:hypothetical protein
VEEAELVADGLHVPGVQHLPRAEAPGGTCERGVNKNGSNKWCKPETCKQGSGVNKNGSNKWCKPERCKQGSGVNKNGSNKWCKPETCKQGSGVNKNGSNKWCKPERCKQDSGVTGFNKWRKQEWRTGR